MKSIILAASIAAGLAVPALATTDFLPTVHTGLDAAGTVPPSPEGLLLLGGAALLVAARRRRA